MTLRKIRETVANVRSSLVTNGQPPYHREIDTDYLDALQRQVDGAKPKGFKLTPISEPGW